MQTRTKIAVTLLVLGAAASAVVQAQEEHAEGHAAALCGEQEVATGELGIKGLACGPCTQTRRDGRWIWRFDAEPEVLEVDPNGPAKGKLEAGDEIVSVDGLLITSAEGGDRWSTVGPADIVTLQVRRDGRERTVRIQAGSHCEKRASSNIPHHVDVAIQRIEHGEHRDITLIEILPKGWFGFSFSCRCMAHVGETQTTWEFEDAPEIVAVAEGGPAARAGIEVGDHIVAADGYPITENEGAARLTTAQPGDTVQLTIQRHGDTLTVEITAAERPMRE